MSVLAGGAETGGAFSLIDMRAGPHETPFHIHHGEDEAFYVLEGRAEFVTEGRTTPVGPGTYVFLPREVAHGFRIVGDQPARMLVWTIPSGFEEFFAEMGEPAQSLTIPPFKPLDIPKAIGLSSRFRLEILGPLSLGER